MLLVFVKMEMITGILFVLTCTGIYSYPISDKTSPYCFDYNFNDDSEYKQYLSVEIKQDAVFKTRWNKGITGVPNSNKYTENELRAIRTYTGDCVYPDFNRATRDLVNGKTSYKDYRYKALHYYLSSVIQKSKYCPPGLLYRGSTFKDTTAKVGDKDFKFKQFTSSSLSDKTARVFSTLTGTLYAISTCAGADISTYSCYPGEKEILIPPCAEFTVTSIIKATSSDPQYIVLNGGGTKNALNRGDTFREVTASWFVAIATVLLIQYR